MEKGFVYGRITDAELARVKARIGLVYRPLPPAVYNTAASKDAIRHFCDGIGDDNDLYRDEGYAARSPYGAIIAPPSFLYSVHLVSGVTGFPGVHGFHAGSEWEFHKTIRLGDSFTVTTRLIDLSLKEQSEFAGRSLVSRSEGFFHNQRGELVAKVEGWSVKTERRAGKEMGKYQKIERYRYADDELKSIEAAYDAEQRRGAVPLYWEDVCVGDELPPVVKGPLNLTDLQAFTAGAVGGAFAGRGGAHKFALLYRRKHPAWIYVDPETGVTDIPERVHVSSAMSAAVGVPEGYDYGHQRQSWLVQLVTNWMGDDGFLKKFRAELRRFNLLGDTTWCKGKVVAKRAENGDALVDLEIWAENQRGELTAPGLATVALPSRGVGWFPKNG